MAELSHPTHPARRRRLWRWLGFAVASLVGVAVIVVAALQTPPARRFVLQKVTSLLAAQDMTFSTQGFGYNLLELSTQLQDVRVRSSRLPDAPPFLQIERARVDASLWQLLRGRYVIQSGQVEGVRVHYFVDEHGIDNLPHPVRDPDQPSRPVDYLISQLSVPDARIRYEDRARDIDVTVPRATVSMQGSSLTRRHAVEIEANGGDARYGSRSVHLDRIAATLDLGQDDVKIERAELEGERMQVSASGTVGPFAEPNIDVALQATVDSARALEVAKVGESISGQVGVEGSIKGPPAALAIDARVTASDVQVRDLTSLGLDTSFTYQIGNEALRVSRLHLTGPMGTIDGRGVFAIAGSSPSSFDATVAALQAEPLMRALRVPYRIATRLDGTVNAQWPGMDYAKAIGNAKVSLTPTPPAAARRTLALGGRIDAVGDGQRVTARLNGLRAAGASIDGRVVLRDRDRLDGALQAAVPDVRTTVAGLESFLGRGPLMPVPIAGALSATAQLGGRIAAPTVLASIRAPSLAIAGATGVSVMSDVAYRGNLFAINRFDAAWRDARAAASGTVALAGRQALDLRVDVEAVPVDEVLRSLDYPNIPASGSVAAQARVTGTIANPSAGVQLQGHALTAYQELLGELAADARYANRRIDITALRLEKPQASRTGVVTATASYDLPSQRYTLDVDSRDVRLESLELPAAHRVTGAVALQARSQGTVSSPAGSVNLRADDLVVDGYEIGALTADTTLANAVATTRAAAARLGLTATATVGVSRPYPATIAAQVNELDLAALPIQIQTPLEGRLQAQLDAEGPLSDPQSGRATATVETFSGSWRQQPFSLDGPARVRYSDERLTIEQLRLRAQDSTVAVAGDLPLSNRGTPGTMTIDAAANLATLAQYAPVGSDVAADGRLALTGSLRGTLKALDPDLRLTLTDALILAPAIEPGVSNLSATATVARGEATVEQLSANWGTAQVELSARVPLDLLPELPVEIPRNGGPATLHASLDGLNPSAIPGAPAGLNGSISLDADVSSQRPDVRDATGRLVFRDLRVGFGGLTLEQKAPSAIALREGVATIEQFSLGGSVGTLAASGSVVLTGARPIDVNVDGRLNIAAVSIVTDRVRAEGDSVIDIGARGTVADPILSGNVTISDGAVVIDEPRIAAENLNARIDLADSRATVSSLTADVNGGTLTGSGGLAIRNGTVADVDMNLAMRDFAFDAPLDLRSLSDSDIRLTSQGDDIAVSGQITIQEAGLTGDINFDTGLLASITARRQLELTPERNPLLDRMALNVNVDTASPILVDNNLAKAEVTADLRVVGSPYETGLLGNLNVAEGGLVTLNERTFEIERGQVTFLEDRRIFPSFDLQMNTSANSYDITLGVRGEPGDTETTLTSNPSLPEPDIMSMIVTGRTLEQMRGEEYDVAREQVLSYLTGRVGSTIGRSLERASGLSEVRIEPHLIANEADPGARLTLGQDVTTDLNLTYSVDLADSDDQIWLATYDVTRRFQTRAARQNDNTYRVDFRHDIRKGGRPEPRRMPRLRPIVGTVSVPDDAPIAAPELRDMLSAEEGKELDYFAVRNGIEDIEQRLRDAGWSQSRVRLTRAEDSGRVTLALRITRGPQVEFTYAGMTPPRKVQDEVRVQWHRGVFDAQRTDDAAETLREWLMRDDYLQAKVTYRVEDVAADRRVVGFNIEPGPRSRRVLLAFEGAAAIPAGELDQVIDEQKLERQLFTDPVVVTELLRKLYREQGYLNVEVDAPRYEFEGELARVVVAIREGVRFTVNDVIFTGNTALPASALEANLPVVEGDPYMPAAVENALQAIRNRYWARGYNDVKVAHQLTVDRVGGRTTVAFTINEGRQAIVSEIRIAGNDETSERLVREQLIVTPAEPLNLQALSRSRKNLYDSGAFSVVDLSRDTVVEAAPAASRTVVGALAGTSPAQKPVVVDVEVREVQPYQFRYGASYDTEGKLGGVFDASMHNVLGKARVVGMSSRYDARLREARGYMTQPTLRHWPIQTTASVYYSEERNPATATTNAFNLDRKGASIQQERKLKDSYVWTYGYRFERSRTFDPNPDRTPEQLTKVSPLTTAFVRETRDEVLDATRGSFSSHALSFSPKWLGSDDTYIKYFGQYYHYFPLQRERRKRFSNEIIRPRFVFATAARVGISKGLGAFVPTSERFFAGGSTTLRGFEQNAVGPVTSTGIPIGGDALLLFNNELRFPLVSLVDGVTFVDIGNVWQRGTGFSFSDLRKTAGVGLRLRTKWVLVRGDYGLVLDRRAGERKGRFYFSIGQAF